MKKRVVVLPKCVCSIINGFLETIKIKESFRFAEVDSFAVTTVSFINAWLKVNVLKAV